MSYHFALLRLITFLCALYPIDDRRVCRRKHDSAQIARAKHRKQNIDELGRVLCHLRDSHLLAAKAGSQLIFACTA